MGKFSGVAAFLSKHKVKVGALLGAVGGLAAGQLPLNDFLQAVINVLTCSTCQ